MYTKGQTDSGVAGPFDVCGEVVGGVGRAEEGGRWPPGASPADGVGQGGGGTHSTCAVLSPRSLRGKLCSGRHCGEGTRRTAGKTG